MLITFEDFTIQVGISTSVCSVTLKFVIFHKFYISFEVAKRMFMHRPKCYCVGGTDRDWCGKCNE